MSVRRTRLQPVQARQRELEAHRVRRRLVQDDRLLHPARLRVIDQVTAGQRIGLIGSKTKWATFRHRLAARGFGEAEMDRVTCPIGLGGIAGKEPEVIAVGVAAQLLQSLGPRG